MTTRKRASASAGGATDWISYNFAVLRVVPHVHIGTFIPVGIVLHARTSEFLGVRVITDVIDLRSRLGDADIEVLSRYLESCRAIGQGDFSAGPIALAPPSERFHWLTAPRSDVIQSGPVHEGLCFDPAAELERLFTEIIPGSSNG
ncbi:MAG: DUF3037 domain-containing protein [Gemmatimonadales bacterium]